MREVAPQAGKDQLLPTRQLWLGGRAWRPSLLLLEDVEDLCGVRAGWGDSTHLYLRAPAALGPKLRVKDGQAWGSVTVKVELHEDAVLLRQWSPDGERCLLAIGNCQQTQWNVYLRRKGEAAFNAAMDQGWDDPDVFGGFGWDQPPASLKWTGPRSATILVHGRNHGVTLRDRCGDVQLQWTFTRKDKKAGPQEGRPLPFVKFEPAAKP